MAKSIARKIRDASDLAAIAALKTEEVVNVSIWCNEIHFHLKPFALARVFRCFNVTQSKLNCSVSKEGDQHVTFAARGATWTTCVLAKHRHEWQSVIDHEAAPRLEARPLALPGFSI